MQKTTFFATPKFLFLKISKSLYTGTYLVRDYNKKYVKVCSRDLTVKERITVTIDKELLKYLDKKIADKIFANRSHGFEFLIKRDMEDKKK